MGKKLRQFVNWYILGKYHCDKCPYCWGGGYSAGFDDYDDCGCYIKGDIRDTCRLLPPFRFLLGWAAKKKAQYHFNHEYDDYADFMERQEKEQDEFNRLLTEALNGYELCWKDDKGLYHPINTEAHIGQEAWRIRSGYDDFAHPVRHIPIRAQWFTLFNISIKAVANKIKPYLCE